jgi:hypothetical protein
MRDAKWVKSDIDLRGAVSHRVLDAIKLVHEEMKELDDDERLPEMPAGVLMKKRWPDGGRLGQ